MNTLITICARGNSKGLPNKHLLEFNGKPLILWTVKQAVDWDKGDIALSSDSSDIRNLVTKHFFIQNAIKRPNDLSGDNVPKLDAIRHTLIETEERLAKRYDVIVDLDATNPLRKSDDIEKCYQEFIIKKPCNMLSVNWPKRNPYFNQIEYHLGNYRLPCGKFPYPTTRDQMDCVWDLNSSIYIYDRAWLLEGHKHPIDPNSEIYLMEKWQSFDIDDEIDFKVAEMLMRKYVAIP